MIRQEAENDYPAVYAVVKAAFASAQHSDGNEQDLVEMLRKGASFLPQLSLVAEREGKIVGHILFTKAMVGEDTVLALAPLSVLPEYQKQGIGAGLIQAGHHAARDLGYDWSIVLGSEQYYPRYGYLPAETFGIKPPFDVPRENFMALQLRENSTPVKGVVKYAKEFGID